MAQITDDLAINIRFLAAFHPRQRFRSCHDAVFVHVSGEIHTHVTQEWVRNFWGRIMAIRGRPDRPMASLMTLM